ncbi:10858_t:CDS:1, partial [Gigaspora margarita]
METLETMDVDFEYYCEMEDNKYYNDNNVNSKITESSVTSTKTLYLPTTDTSSIQTKAHPPIFLKNKEED